MQHRVGEPPVEILAAAITCRHWLLRLAVRAVRRAVDADMEMIVVLPILPHLVEPGAIVTGLAAERLLDRRIDEDALDLGLLGSRLDQRRVRRRPDPGIDI